MAARLSESLGRVPDRVWIGAVVVVALVARLPLLFSSYDSSLNPDAPLYLAIANGILHGPDAAGSSPVGDFRPPGYPAFIALLQLLPGRTADTVVFVQHLLGVLLSASVFIVGARYFGRAVGLVAGLLVAMHHAMGYVEHEVFADFLFGAIVWVGTVVLMRGVAERRISLVAVAGLCFGLSAYVKPVGQVLLLAPLIALGLGTRDWRFALKGFAAAAVALLVVTAPWLVRNQVVYGHPTMSIQGGDALWWRVFDQDRLAMTATTPEEVQAKAIYERTIAGTSPGQITYSHTAVLSELNKRGLSLPDALALERRMSLRAIKADPAAYAKGTAKGMLSMSRLLRGYGAARANLGHVFERNDPPLQGAATASWSVANVLNYALFYLSLAGAAGVLLLFGVTPTVRAAGASLLAVWTLLAFATTAAGVALERYAVSLGTLLWLLSAAGVARLVQLVVAAVRRRRAGVRDGVVDGASTRLD
jgi:4-amino-4-deoxy-L-arabinose transferase-like glycosyltransferase